MAQESPKNTLDEIQKHLTFLPDWVFTALLLLALLGGLLALLKNWMPLVQAVKRSLTWIFRPRTDKRRVRRRAVFADHVESQLRRLGEKEEWRDSRYVELEAELEIIGERGSPWRRRSSYTVRRVPSLSAALERTDDRIVLLEGEPGSGKSVALRHLAQRMARAAAKDPTTIPIYVNLKTFVPVNADPGADDVRDFVLQTINQVRDRDVERFLDEEFDQGLESGIWLFLFDSFDEIPAILSVTEADAVITSYADALHGFLHGMNRCRGVVASREFRGPGRKAWPTFRVVPLSRKRKVDLVEKADLPTGVEQVLLADLPTAKSSVQQMSDNPLFLSLLCEHVRGGNEFPTNVHSVLETYVGHRLARDAERVFERFGVTHDLVREVAEELAFAMAESLGLVVDKARAVHLVATGLQRTEEEVGKALDGLQYTKLARAEEDDDSSVTFSHRRLQEYFATCTVMRDPARIPARTLLADGRWRETAVTVLQTQNASALLDEAVRLLPGVEAEFAWRPGTLHLLGLLAEGSTPEELAGTDIPRKAGAILRQAWEHGMRYDRRWALECCSAADRETCLHLVRSGFASDSEWLRQESYEQVRKVPDIVDDVAPEVRQALVDMTVGGRLRKERRSVRSQIGRLPDPARFLLIYRLLLAAPLVDLAVCSLFAVSILWSAFTAGGDRVDAVAALVFVPVLAIPYQLFRVGRLSPPALRRQFPYVKSWLPDAPRRVRVWFPVLACVLIALLLVFFVRGSLSGWVEYSIFALADELLAVEGAIWFLGALLVYLLLPVIKAVPLSVGWVLDRVRIRAVLNPRLDVSAEEFSAFLHGIRTIRGAQFFFTEARERELTWSVAQVGVLTDLAEASGEEPRWLANSDVLDALNMLLGDVVRSSSKAARADPG